MKKYLTILALLASMPLFAEHVDPEIAQKAAASFLSNNGVKATQLTDISKAAGFPNLYIFNGENGFVILSADDCAKPVLGYSLTGKFTVDDMPENLSAWLQDYNDEIQYAIDNQWRASSETAQQWKDLINGKPNTAKATSVVSPLIQTQWAQGSPYNGLCPTANNTQAITGCVATAMAQIMKFWNYPTRGIGSHSYQYSPYGTISADFGATVYDWDNMPNTYSSSSTVAQKTAVATLMYHCGVSVEMKYGPNESGSNTQRSSYAMSTYFNYHTSYLKKSDYTEVQDWTDLLKNELDNGRPILYAGDGNQGGHAFVCDGYDSEGYFHFNWGWGGSHDDEYFLISDSEPTPGSYDFSSNQAAVIGIYPLTNDDTPITLTNSQATLTWTDSQNCSSYNVYRNDALIATTTETTFTDPHPMYGSNKYYIRGVNGSTITQPSNYAVFSVDYPTPTVSNFHAEPTDNGLTLSWESPAWCFPSTADAETFAYVDEKRTTHDDSYFVWTEGNYALSWGHRYPAALLTNYNGKAIHEISFFSMFPGAFDIIVYQDTEDDHPVEEITRASITTARIGWSRVRFDAPAIIDSSKDLWIFVSNTDYKVYTVYNTFVTGNTEGCYFSGNDPSQACLHEASGNIVWPIRAYLTDGTYTYNVYQDDVKIANELTGTTSNATLNNNAPNQFVVKTNYCDGEAASNTIGYAKGTASVASLNLSTDNKMTVTNSSILTVTGELTSNHSDNLILENGAQLISSSTNVEATVKRDIETFGLNDKGHWYLIASPMIDEFPVGETNLTSTTANNYDLYLFDQNAEGSEWRNYKAGRFTHIKNKVGYLYASAENTCVTFAGTLNNTDGEVALTYSDQERTFRGYNLIGNPFPCNATLGSRSFYRVVENNGISELQAVSGTVYPMEGIIVQAQNAGDNTVTFVKETPSSVSNTNNSESITMDISQGQGVIDRAIIRFDEGSELGKIMLNPENTKLYIPQDGKDYAVATSDMRGEMPISFKAHEDGAYTLTVSGTPNSSLLTPNFKYLHLIDNLTGADIDLLVTPSYSFEAKADDYASRFKLVFSTPSDNGDDIDDNFAFIDADGNLIVNGTGTLQIFDVLGHQLLTKQLPTPHSSLLTPNSSPGVYVLRIITENETKTQKIIIK